MEKARMPWHGADDNWGEGFPGLRGQLPPGAEAITEPPLREASVGWGIWVFYEDPPADEQQEEDEQQEQDEQQQQQQEPKAEEAEQPQEPLAGQWWRGMVWWFPSKEAKYKLVMEDGEYLPNVTVPTMTDYLKKGEAFFSRPPCNWPLPQHLLGEQPSSASVDAQAEQQQQHEQEAAAASGKRAKQQTHKQEHRKPQQQQQQQQQQQLRDGTELVKQGLALQKQALQELPAGLTSEQVSRYAREVKTALSVGEDKTGAQLLTTVKHLAEDHWGLLPGSQEVHGSAEQLYQQMLQKRKPPGTPSKAAAAAAAVKQEGEWAAAAAGGSSASLQDLAAAGAGGGLGKRGRDGSIKQEHAAAAAAEQPSPSYQQDADEEPGAAAGVDGGGKGTWDLAHFQSLVPVRCLDDPLRDTAVALLSAVLQPPAAASPFALAHELEAKLHDQHGMIGPGKHMYLRHLYMIWCVLGGRELAAAAEAAQRARAAAAEGGDEDAAAAAAAADKAVAAARAELEGVPGVADAAAVRAALLEGAASVEELFDMTRTQLGFDQQRDK
ncbi:hypothetical protein OEZ86_006204 [Tetradesmus obliquus]|nr:hypothetical protein OEZ86_006204 [Tetradesmus obliquus]